MKGCIQSKLLLVAAVNLFMLMALPAFAAGNCSPYLGQASINELFKDRTNQANDPDDFVEIKIIDPALTFATFSQWTIQLCERNDAGNNQDNDGCSAKISLAGLLDSTPPWIVLKDGSIGSFFNFKTGFDAILLDENDDVVDYVSVDGYTLQEQSGCTGTALAFPYQASAPGSSVKFIFRSPDGTGPWGGPTSAAALPTEGASNDGTSLPALDHYAISHAGTGVTCEAESVSIIAHDSLHNAVAPSSSTTIALSTTVANDGWALKTGSGIFTPPNQYTFDGNETAVEFWLTKLTAAIIDIDVSDGTATD
ncbi:MAG: hypothetical protein HKN34_01045, partial [Gammaproteobacteria bacterium]|nr:hypothetical protein [Gammaproteobacteria bacterium]